MYYNDNKRWPRFHDVGDTSLLNVNVMPRVIAIRAPLLNSLLTACSSCTASVRRLSSSRSLFLHQPQVFYNFAETLENSATETEQK